LKLVLNFNMPAHRDTFGSCRVM